MGSTVDLNDLAGSELRAWAEDYEATYGLPPMGGAETPEQTPTATVEPTAEPGEEPTNGSEPPEYIQQLSSRMDEVASRLEDMQPQQQAPGLVDLLASPQQQNGQQEAQPQGQQQTSSGQATPEPQETDQGGPDQAALIEQYIDTRAEEKARETFAPYVQAQEQQRIRDEAQDFLEDYPEIRDDREAQEALMRNTQRMAQELGTPEAAREPRFLELVHLASRQLAASNSSETPSGEGDQQQVALEPGSGVNPGSASTTNDDRAAAIVAAKGNGLNSFWGGRG